MYFATHFDKNYITRAEVMFKSLIDNLKNNLSKLYLLALDEVVITYFQNRENIEIIMKRIMKKYEEKLMRRK